LAARPAFHHSKASISAHLTIVFAALAVGHWIETTTGLSLRRFIRTLRPIRQNEIDVAGHSIVAENEIGDAARRAITSIEAAAHPPGH
jgi:hypothetical protein